MPNSAYSRPLPERLKPPKGARGLSATLVQQMLSGFFANPATREYVAKIGVYRTIVDHGGHGVQRAAATRCGQPPIRARELSSPISPATPTASRDEGVRSCPRAGCGRSARPVLCFAPTRSGKGGSGADGRLLDAEGCDVAGPRASASASPSRGSGNAQPPLRPLHRGPGNGILWAETGGRFQPQNAGERPEFGSQTATRLTNRLELRGFLPARKPRRFAGTPRWVVG